MPWKLTGAVDVLPGQRVFVAMPPGASVAYRVGIVLSVITPSPYRRYGYLSLFYGIGGAGFAYAGLHPLGSVWEPVVVYGLERPVANNGFVFHRAVDKLGSYQIRFLVNDTD